MAERVGISPLVVGLTVVAFGTSAPEIAISVGSSAVGQGAIALGNVIGSNIFNVLFILGLSAIVAPLAVSAQLVRIEVPLMTGISVATLLLALDGTLGLVDGTLLLSGAAAYLTFVVVQARRTEDPAPDASASAVPSALGGAWAVQVGLVLGGLALLVLGLSGVVAPAGVPVAPEVLWFDLPVMIGVAVACLPVFFTGGRIARWEGAVFFGYYVAFVTYVVLAATSSAGLPTFRLAMGAFVVPLTVITLLVTTLQAWRARSNPS